MKMKYLTPSNILLVLTVCIGLLLINWNNKKKVQEVQNHYKQELGTLYESLYSRDSLILTINKNLIKSIKHDSLSNFKNGKVFFLYIPQSTCWGCSLDQINSICNSFQDEYNLVLLGSKSVLRKLYLVRSENNSNFKLLETDKLFSDSDFLSSVEAPIYLVYDSDNKSCIAYLGFKYYDFPELLKICMK